MVVSANDPNGVYDTGAKFNAGVDGKTIVQILPDGGKVDPALAAFITANTGGSALPYGWQDVQLGKVTPMALSPNYNTITPAANGCVTAECAASVGAVRNPVDPTKLDGNYGVGFYPGLVPGGELEIELQNGTLVGGKVGAGFGVGGHLNLGTKSIGGGLLQGPVAGGKAPALVETNPQQPGEVRVGPAGSMNLGVGTVGMEFGYSRGASVTDNGVGNYSNFTVNPTISPVLPKLGAEVKVNLIEFTVKPPAPTPSQTSDSSKVGVK
jgi:filamentous hemagglutinin